MTKKEPADKKMREFLDDPITRAFLELNDNCPKCDIPLTPNYKDDLAFCLMCDYIIYEVSKL